jgi:hypothetical protein
LLPSGCLDLVRAIEPKTYRQRALPAGQGDRLNWGFVAQEVGAAMAAAGHDFGGHVVENGVEGLSYNDLLAVLWKAVQELQAEVSQLRDQVARQ